MTQYVIADGGVDSAFREFVRASSALPEEIYALLTDEAQELWRSGAIEDDTVMLRDDVHQPQAAMPGGKK